MSKPVILTGLRANNDLTLGNYLGGLLPIIDMAKKRAGDYQVNLFMPDLHSFTTPIDHSQLQANIMQNIRIFVAAGLPIEHDDVYLYRQSYIPAHSELTWILDCFTGFGQMSRMTQFKDKSRQQAERKLGKTIESALAASSGDFVSVGLFNYPVLMAADILLYNTSYVPVGDDQTQHVEFTRDIGERMNNQFGQLFTVPLPVPKQHEFFGKDQGLRIRDLADPIKKMSKSDETGKGVIFLTDTPEVAAKKIMSATTDSFGEVKYDMRQRPGVSNLLTILALLSSRDLRDVIAKWEGQTRYGDLKKAVAEVVATFLQDFQTRLAQVDDAAVHAKLTTSEAAMRDIANATLLRVQTAVGLR